MARSIVKCDHRTDEQIKEHYKIEKALAEKLRGASKNQRRELYSSLYDELYRRVPYHSQLTRKSSPMASARAVNSQMNFLRRFLSKDLAVLEIGPGDCALSLELTKHAKQVYAVDVSDEIAKVITCPQNFHLYLSDGCSIPVASNSVDLAYSNQLMEHLHPDDAILQLQNIFNALVQGGKYICITPNRLSGPHDISRNFDKVATGFHLKEYTVSELEDLFKSAGFSRIKVYVGAKGKYLCFPASFIIAFEKILDKLPYKLTRLATRLLPVKMLLGIRLMAVK